ncbi:MAG: caspase family protein [Prevotella sp.]|nr:caspase family protein [Prevotella sp.]
MNRLLLILIIAIYLPLSTMGQKTYVLCVGIADYENINDLTITENDAKVFAQLMSTQGAETTVLLGKDATHVNIISALRSVFAKATIQDKMIFYFSGHGYEGGFCCYDMATTSATGAQKYMGGLSYAEMQILFRNCRAGQKMVFADACFAGGLRKGEHVNISVQSARNGDVIYFLSSQTDETSLEMKESGNSLFTYYLVKGLSGEADSNTDKYITALEIYNYVYKEVSEYAAKIPHSQHPVMWGKFDSNIKLFNLK